MGLVAEVVIDAASRTRQPLVLRQLPDFGFVLQPNTPAEPARMFVTQSDAGVEVVVEGLPVEIQLPERAARCRCAARPTSRPGRA